MRRATAAGEELLPALEAAWAREVEWTWRRAAQALEAHARALTAAAPWVPPVQTELVNSDAVKERLERQTSQLRVRIAAAAGMQIAAEFDVPWDVRNPMVQGVLHGQGHKIVRIAESERAAIMDIVNTAWEDGLSIPHTAARLRDMGQSVGLKRGRTIARTEMIRAVNGGALAQINLVNQSAIDAGEEPIASTKSWLATADERTRPTHADADGQTVPIDATFSVGADQLRYPGDPDGSAEEVINCRCTVTFG